MLEVSSKKEDTSKILTGTELPLTFFIEID